MPSVNLPADEPEEGGDAVMAEGGNKENEDAPMAVDEANEELNVSSMTTGLVLTYY